MPRFSPLSNVKFSSMDHAKKTAEERILKRFVSNKELGLIISTIQPLEPPDFKMKRYVNDEFKNIGVELTRVINPNLMQYESGQDKIVKMAHETFKSVLSDKLTVYVDFSKAPFSLDPISLRSLSESLAKIVTDVALKNKGFLFRVETDQIALPVEFDKLTIEKNDDDFENWQRFASFSVPYVNENWFAEIIKKKEARIPSYSETFDENWLILAANFGNASSHFQFTNLKLSLQNSPFERVFIYLFRDDKVIVLK